tara:strand:- start:1078 stop:2052 length:975 start_codon:yes stop_codon:yes gene_type:complete
MLKVLDLFSGIGGFSLGLERTGGFKTVAFCEIEDYPRKVLAKHWPDVPCHKDVRELDAEKVGAVDVITGGYPCQPFSLAGVRKGDQDDRHLWPEVHRLVASIRPRWCIFENVYGHVSMGLDKVLSDLDDEGYTSQTFIVPACAVDAPHRRDRVWIVATTESGDAGQLKQLRGDTGQQDNSEVGAGLRAKLSRSGETVADTSQLQRNVGGEYTEQGERQVPQSGKRGGKTDVADSDSDRVQGGEKQRSDGGNRQKPRNQQSKGRSTFGTGGSGGAAKWLPEPPVGRVAHGVSRRVDRLKGLGNAVVPQIPEMIGYAILEAEKDAP